MKCKAAFCSALFIFVAAGISNVRPGWAATDDATAVMQASSRFYVALNEMFTGNVEPMLEVWSHADDVMYMGPAGGLQIGWADVKATWKEQAALKLGGKVVSQDLHLVLNGNTAVTYNYEKGENIDSNGVTQAVSIRASNVFRKENGKWMMTGHHTDLLPFLEK
jgi:ketosteroid isomerase-like protein